MTRRLVGFGAGVGSGTVTSITAGTGLTGGTITTTGTIAVANPVSNVTVSGQGYLLLPNLTDFLQASGSTSNGGAGGTVRCALMQIDRAITFTKMTVNVTTASNTNKIYLGIYNAAATTLLVQGTITMTAATGLYTATVSATSLTPGAYWWVFSTDNVAIVMTGCTAPSATPLTVLNANNVAWGFSTNVLSGSTLPATLGSITANAAVLPLCKLEP